MGIRMKSGQIIDVRFVSVPVQRNTRKENAVIKEGAVPLEWGKTPNKLAHKDVDARWTKKGGQRYYGYKNHVNMDREMKLVAARSCVMPRQSRAFRSASTWSSYLPVLWIGPVTIGGSLFPPIPV